MLMPFLRVESANFFPVDETPHSATYRMENFKSVPTLKMILEEFRKCLVTKKYIRRTSFMNFYRFAIKLCGCWNILNEMIMRLNESYGIERFRSESIQFLNDALPWHRISLIHLELFSGQCQSICTPSDCSVPKVVLRSLGRKWSSIVCLNYVKTYSKISIYSRCDRNSSTSSKVLFI